MKTHLVTGGAGFIGSHLCDKLLADGHAVIAIDDFSLGTYENLIEAIKHEHFKFLEGDVANSSFWHQLAKDCPTNSIDVIWHMAANSDISAGVKDSTVDLHRTFLTTFHTLEAAKALGVKHFALASTSAVYGDLQSVLSEDSAPLNPISNYGAMKLASEAAATAKTSTDLDKLWIFRFPNVVGPRSTHGVIHDFVRKLNSTPRRLEVLGDGTQCKPYLHVIELLDAMMHTVRNSNEKINRFLIGPLGDKGTTVRYIADLVIRLYGTNAEIVYGNGNRGWVGDVPTFTYSTDKIYSLGWKPKLTSNQTIDKAVGEIVAELKSPVVALR